MHVLRQYSFDPQHLTVQIFPHYISEKNKQTWITAGDEHALPLYVDHMFTSPLKPKVVYHYHKHYKGYLYKHLE